MAWGWLKIPWWRKNSNSNSNPMDETTPAAIEARQRFAEERLRVLRDQVSSLAQESAVHKEAP